MIGAVLRWGLVAAGLACAALSVQLWRDGVPPLWTFVAPRVETVVLWADLAEAPAPDGRNRQAPNVQVAWPPGAASAAPLDGLSLADDVWRLHTPAEVLRQYPTGARVMVRSVGGRPVVDKTDLRELGWTLTASLMAVLLAAAGIALTISRYRREKRSEATA